MPSKRFKEVVQSAMKNIDLSASKSARRKVIRNRKSRKYIDYQNFNRSDKSETQLKKCERKQRNLPAAQVNERVL